MRGTSVQKQQAVKPVLPPCYEKKTEFTLKKPKKTIKKPRH